VGDIDVDSELRNIYMYVADRNIDSELGNTSLYVGDGDIDSELCKTKLADIDTCFRYRYMWHI